MICKSEQTAVEHQNVGENTPNSWKAYWKQCVELVEESPGPRGPCRETVLLRAAGLALQHLAELPTTERHEGLYELRELIPAERDEIMRHWTNDPPSFMVDPIIEAQSSFHRMADIYSQLPPESMREVEDLAKEGPSIAPHLRGWEGCGAQVAAACVRTLGQVGGDEALAAIGEYARLGSPSVVREVLAAARHFDIDEFSQRILSGLNLCDSVCVRNRQQADAAARIARLRALHVCKSRSFRDISFVKRLPELQCLAVTHKLAERSAPPDIEGFKALCGLHALKTLVISIDYRFTYQRELLDRLPSVRNLVLDPLPLLPFPLGSFQYSPVPLLEAIAKRDEFSNGLRRLWVNAYHQNSMNVVGRISGLTHLSVFHVKGQPLFAQTLLKLKRLRTLDIHFPLEQLDLRPLSKHPSLRYVRASNLDEHHLILPDRATWHVEETRPADGKWQSQWLRW